MDTEDRKDNLNDATLTAAPGTETGEVSGANSAPAEALETLKTEAAKAREHWERLLRVTADFENYKKRMTRERQDASKYAYLPLMETLLPVLDHFDMALAAAQNTTADSLAAFHEGITMIHQQLRSALTGAGLEEVNAAGQPFDPNWHEAVSQEPTDAVPEGHVTQQLRKGYKFRDRLLRPATVVVAKPPEPAPEPHPGQPAAATES